MESLGDGRKGGGGSFGVGDGGCGDERRRYEGRKDGDDGKWHGPIGKGESGSRWCPQDRRLYGGGGGGGWHRESDRVGHQWQAGGVLTSNWDLQRSAQEWRGDDGSLHRETRGWGHVERGRREINLNHYSKAIHSHRGWNRSEGRGVGQKRLPGGSVPDRWLDFLRMVGIILLPTFSEGGGVTKSSISSLVGQSEEYESGKRKGNDEESAVVKKLRSANCSFSTTLDTSGDNTSTFVTAAPTTHSVIDNSIDPPPFILNPSSTSSASVSSASLTSVSSASASLVSPFSSPLAEDSSTSSFSVSSTSMTLISSASASLVSPCRSILAAVSSTSSSSVSSTFLTSVSSASACLVSPCGYLLAEDCSTSSSSVSSTSSASVSSASVSLVSPCSSLLAAVSSTSSASVSSASWSSVSSVSASLFSPCSSPLAEDSSTSLASISSVSASLVSPCSSSLVAISSTSSSSVSSTFLTSVSSASARLFSPCSSSLAEDSNTSTSSVSRTSLTPVSSSSASLVSPCSYLLAADSSTSSSSVSSTSSASVSSASWSSVSSVSASLFSPCSSSLSAVSSKSSASDSIAYENLCMANVSKRSEGGDSWLPFVPMGCRLGGILPCKTFLDVCFDNRLSEDELWHPTNLRQQIEGHLSLLGEDQKGLMSLDYFRKHQPVVAVINLCLTERHYDRDDFRSQGIEHYWLKVDGGGEIPTDRVLSRFFRLMQYLGSRHPGKIVAVHCTHGVNRTGYFLVAFLMVCYGLPFDIAHQWFQKSRGHPMNREELISCLEQLPNRVRKNDHNVAKLFEFALVPLQLQSRYDTEEKRFGNCGYMASSFSPEVNPLLAVNGSAACDGEGSEGNGVSHFIHKSVSDQKVLREDLKETTESFSQQRCEKKQNFLESSSLSPRVSNCRVLFGPLSDDLVSPEDLYVSLLYHNSVICDIVCLRTCDTKHFPQLAVASQEKISVPLYASTNDTLASIATSRLRHHWIAEVVVQDDASVNILMKAGLFYLKGAQVTARAPQEFLNIYAEALVADQRNAEKSVMANYILPSPRSGFYPS